MFMQYMMFRIWTSLDFKQMKKEYNLEDSCYLKIKGHLIQSIRKEILHSNLKENVQL